MLSGATMSVFNRKTLLVSAGLLVIPILGHAAVCTNASLVGPYGYQEEGQAIGAGFSQFRSVGAFTFDGKGNGSRVTTIWYSTFEVAAEPSSLITYAVQPDCRFILTYAVNGETFAGIIVDGGQKLLYIETSGDPSRSGQAERLKSGE
jgi:hypothetical protein